MKWISLIIGGVIVVGGIWLLMKPGNANGPAPEETMTSEGVMESTEHEGAMEDGTLDSKGNDAMEKSMDDHNTTRSNKTESVAVTEEEPMGDPIFHALVEYTDNGFSPASVTINKGETVRFMNNSSRGVWVGGNNHPTHTQYPEKSSSDCLGTAFDTCRTLDAAEFWEFTFNHVGSWGYHNHVRARDAGTVIVQ